MKRTKVCKLKNCHNLTKTVTTTVTTYVLASCKASQTFPVDVYPQWIIGGHIHIHP